MSEAHLDPPVPAWRRRRPSAVVVVGAADVRRRPDHRSELVSQALYGETLKLGRLSHDGRWVEARGMDRYPGWVRVWGLAGGSAASVRAWRDRARHLVDRPAVWRVGADPGPLPIGSRVGLERGRIVGPFVPLGTVPARGFVRRVPARPVSGRAAVEAAARLLGAPYHWGGRTSGGIDCSGLVQLGWRLAGIELPRDARDQCRWAGGVRRLTPMDEALRPGRSPRAGDLWFFGPAADVTHVALSTGGLGLLHAYGRVRPGSLDPADPAFEPELFQWVRGFHRMRYTNLA